MEEQCQWHNLLLTPCNGKFIYWLNKINQVFITCDGHSNLGAKGYSKKISKSKYLKLKKVEILQ